MSFGLTAKERMAQLQTKNAKDAPPPKAAPGNAVKKPGNNVAKPATDAPKPGEAKKPETKDVPKPAEPKKPDAAKPSPGDASKPQAPQVPKKDEPKPPEAKKPEVKEPPKPTEQPKKPEAKPAEAKPKEEPKTPEPAKPKDEPKAPQPTKPKEEPPKPEVKPKEEAKAPEPAKPKDEPKKPEAKPATEPPKPAEQQKAPEPAKTEAKPTEAKPAAAPTATKEPEKPKEEAKPAAPAKPKEEPPKPAEAKPATDQAKVDEKKPTEPPKQAATQPTQPAKPAATEPAKPAADKPAVAADEAKKQEPVPVKPAPQPKTDVFGSIFYFSGMGSLLGSALAEGVYVPESGQKTALDADAVEAASAKRRAINKTEQVVITARNQAQALSTDFRNLQSLLESVPTFGEPLQAQPLDRRGVDQPIHGHVYFRQTEHIPLQAPPSRHGRAHVVPEVSQEAHISATYTTTVQRFPGAKQVLPTAAHPEMHTGPQYQQQQPPPRPYSDHSVAQPHHEPPPHSQWVQPPPPSRSPHPVQPTHHPPAAPAHHDRAQLSHADYGLEAPSQPWQDRYGRGTGQASDAARSPRPFGADVDAGGIKPWQLSHVRGLEAKGYHLVAQPEHDVDADSSSYAPYLVSDRTFNVDRKKTFKRGIEDHHAIASTPYGVHQPAFRPPSTGATYPFAPAVESTMPYCDL